MEHRRLKRAALVFAVLFISNILSSMLLSPTGEINLLSKAFVAALFAAGYLLVTSHGWKKHVLRLKDID